MSFRFIEDHREAYPVRVLCAVLEVSSAGYYAWRSRPPSTRSMANRELVATIRRVHQDSGGRYGSPRVHAPAEALDHLLLSADKDRVATSFESAQYASLDYRGALAAAGITASMSRKADCFDNAPMESFFHTLKTELVHHRQYATRAEAQRDIFAFIEGFYNRTRLHSAIGYISPIEMELKAA
jgi:transposase InsO family protein